MTLNAPSGIIAITQEQRSGDVIEGSIGETVTKVRNIHQLHNCGREGNG